MNKKELEEMFFERFDINSEWTSFGLEDYTDFIFETIIPEVLKSVIWNEKTTESIYWRLYNKELLQRKQKVKENFWIDL